MASQAIGNGVGGVSPITPLTSLLRKTSLGTSMVERKEEPGSSSSFSNSNSQEQFKGLRSGDLEKNARALSRDCSSLPSGFSRSSQFFYFYFFSRNLGD